MYLDHFGLHESPFSITPDTAFTFAAPSHQDALTTLLVALRGGEGFVKVTGEVGTGKTLLCRTLLAALAQEDGVVTAYLPQPQLAPREMLRALAAELRLDPRRRSAAPELHAAIEQGLIAAAEQGQRVVVCIDEAQAMPAETLEALRLLSNLETAKRKLLQIVLFGQPELDTLLASAACRSLASRIGFAAELAPLTRADFARYLQHRLLVAGWRGPAVFGVVARALLYRASHGVPRRANMLAHKALLLAYGDGVHRVSARHAWAAVRDGRRHAPSLRAIGASV
jgi:MSHA biogenesis protein MshM